MKVLILSLFAVLFYSDLSHAFAKRTDFDIKVTKSIRIQVQGSNNNYNAEWTADQTIPIEADYSYTDSSSNVVTFFYTPHYSYNSWMKNRQEMSSLCDLMDNQAIEKACSGNSGKSYSITYNSCLGMGLSRSVNLGNSSFALELTNPEFSVYAPKNSGTCN